MMGADKRHSYDSPYFSLQGISVEENLYELVSHFDVDPMMVLAIIKAVYDAINAANHDKAEQQFRDEVLGKLGAIQQSLNEIKQQIAELGVLLLSAIESVPIQTAESNLFGQLVAVQSAFPDLDHDSERAKRLFDALNAATAAGAKFGPALLPTISVGLVALELLHRYTKQSAHVLRAMFLQYLPILRAYLDENQRQSLVAQKSHLIMLRTTCSLNEFLYGSSGSTVIGTHNYGKTDVIEHISRIAPGQWFQVTLTEQAKPRPDEPGPTGRGGRGGGHPIAIEAFVASSVVDPIPNDQVIYYTTPGLPRRCPTAQEMSAKHGGDHHLDIFKGHIVEHALGANLNVSLQRHIDVRMGALDTSIELARGVLAHAEAMAR